MLKLLITLTISMGLQAVELEVYKLKSAPLSYVDFCQRLPGECDLSGIDSINLNLEQRKLLEKVNTEVNQEIKFVLDEENYDKEEFWNYPSNGAGDCEDNALEKRRRLVAMGVPRGALRMITGFHRDQYYGHAMLSVQTESGILILDQDNPEIVLISEANYISEAREMPQGMWEYFIQEW